MEPTNGTNQGINEQNTNLTPNQITQSKKSKRKNIIYILIFIFLLLIAFIFVLTFKNQEPQSKNITTALPNLSRFGNEFLIYQKDGYIWKWDLSTNAMGKILAYPNPTNSDDTIMWSISPDNQRLLVSHPTKGLLEINLATKKIRTIDPTGDYGLYSPDNQYIYYDGDKKIISENCIEGTPCWTDDTIVANRNGTQKNILPADSLDNLSPQAWSPDGKDIVFGDSNESDFQAISTIDVRTNTITPLVKISDNLGTFFSPAWSPDGSSICSFYGYFYSNPNNPDQTITANSVYVVNVSSKSVRKTKPFSYGENSLCYWSPNSQFFGIITDDSQISIYNKNAILVNNIKLPGSIMMGSADSWKEITWSPNSQYIILNSSKNLYLVNLQTNTYTKILSGVSQTNFSTYWSN